MREITKIMKGWEFTGPDGTTTTVDLPHTWNARDGQDGGNDYWRGTCIYRTRFAAPQFNTASHQVWIQFDGVNASAHVVLKGDAFTLSLMSDGKVSINVYTILFIALFGIGYGAYYATADMPIPMVADCSDYETYISGKYIPGIMGTLFSLVDKLVSSLSATVVGVAVSFIGLDSLPTQYDPYTPGMNVVVIVLFCVIPMIAWAATLLAMKNYSLTGEKMKEIQAVNACRRDAVAGGMSLEDAMQKWQTIDQLPAQYRAN